MKAGSYPDWPRACPEVIEARHFRFLWITRRSWSRTCADFREPLMPS
jgi:hypothetical protein